MRFIFFDKIKTELNIIIDVLSQENIPYKIERKIIKDIMVDEDDDCDVVFIEELYDIHCFTDLKHFDFVKHVVKKQITDRAKLEYCYLKKARKKGVQRVSKKNSTDTNSRDRD